MDLIKDSKDERLDKWSRERYAEKVDWRLIVAVDSLRAALQSVEAHKVVAREWMKRTEAAEKERDEARGQLCKAREALDLSLLQHIRLNKVWEALSSSSPCPHAERVKELEAVLELQAKRMMNTCPEPEGCKDCNAPEVECYGKTELRRRAEEGK